MASYFWLVLLLFPNSRTFAIRIAFFCNQLSERGTEVAIFDYAHYSENILGYRSPMILFPKKARTNNEGTILKFTKRFLIQNVLPLENGWADIDHALIGQGVTHLVVVKFGYHDGRIALVPNIKTCVLVNFDAHFPHGHNYAKVSEGIPDGGINVPVVPHVVPAWEDAHLAAGLNLRLKLGIPAGSIVLGRYGGKDQFNMDFVTKTVLQVAANDNKVFFLFMNTDSLGDENDQTETVPLGSGRVAKRSLKYRIVHLDGSTVIEEKAAFIGACDGMLHARGRGETFGLAVAEFSVSGLPVITSNASNIKERFHLQVLGDRALCYHDEASLKHILLNFRAHTLQLQSTYSHNARTTQPVVETSKYGVAPLGSEFWNAYKEYSPHNVMEKFDRFLKGGKDVSPSTQQCGNENCLNSEGADIETLARKEGVKEEVEGIWTQAYQSLTTRQRATQQLYTNINELQRLRMTKEKELLEFGMLGQVEQAIELILNRIQPNKQETHQKIEEHQSSLSESEWFVTLGSSAEADKKNDVLSQRIEHVPMVTPEDNTCWDVIYYCGATKVWDPLLDVGLLGGAEQAVLGLSSHWAPGLRVMVFGNFSADESLWPPTSSPPNPNKCGCNAELGSPGGALHQGVEFCHVSTFEAAKRYAGTLILWRAFNAFYAPLLAAQTTVRARRIILDLHDSHIPFDYASLAAVIRRPADVAVVAVKSRYHHKILLEQLSSLDRVLNSNSENEYLNHLYPLGLVHAWQPLTFVHHNGIRESSFFLNSVAPKRDPFMLLYSNCYTRGLIPLLQVFLPVLRALEPRVTLHVTYGMDGLTDQQRAIITPYLSQPGVVEHGRVPLEEVVALKKKAAMHLYFTATPIECDCISIRESALLGCVPILSNRNVFAERPGVHLEGDPDNAEDVAAAARTLFKLMSGNSEIDAVREKIARVVEYDQSAPLYQGWEGVAEAWKEHALRLL